MIAFLAMIGLIFFLWLLSKGFKKLGTFLENLGESIAEERAHRKATNTDLNELKHVLAKIKNSKEKLSTLKNDPDKEYMEKVKKEISELTGE